jgi:hypothetical protein
VFAKGAGLGSPDRLPLNATRGLLGIVADQESRDWSCQTPRSILNVIGSS